MKTPVIYLFAVGLVLLALMPLSAHGETVSWVLLEMLINGRGLDAVYDIRLSTHSICLSRHDFPATQQSSPTQAPAPDDTDPTETPTDAPVAPAPVPDFSCYTATCEGNNVVYDINCPLQEECDDLLEYCYYFKCEEGAPCCPEDCEVVDTCSLTESPTTSLITPSPTESPTTSPVTPPPTDSPTTSPTPLPTESPTASPVTPPPTESPTKSPTPLPTESPTKSPVETPPSPTASPVASPSTSSVTDSAPVNFTATPVS